MQGSFFFLFFFFPFLKRQRVMFGCMQVFSREKLWPQGELLNDSFVCTHSSVGDRVSTEISDREKQCE